MIFITDNNLKPNVKDLIKSFVDPKTGIFLDYNDFIKSYYIIKFPIYSWEDDNIKSVEMIRTINGKYNYKRRSDISPFWFRIIPINFYKKSHMVEYHILATSYISHYLTPHIDDYEITHGTGISYMSNAYYKFPFIIHNNLSTLNKKIDEETFAWKEIVYCKPEVKLLWEQL